MNRITLSLFLPVAACQAGGAKQAEPEPTPTEQVPVAAGVPVARKTPEAVQLERGNTVGRQVLVAFRDEKHAMARLEIVRRFKAEEIERVGTSELYLYQLPEGTSVEDTIAELKLLPQVKYAEPNLKVRTLKKSKAR